jgi:gas vesicle protein
MSDEKHGFLGVVFTFLTGAALGAGLALLFAPQSGEETRKKMKEVGEKLSDDLKENYDKITKETQKAVETVKTTSDKAVQQIKSFVETAKGLKKEAAKPKTTTKAK